MKLSKRGEYALRALIDLGISQELGRPLLQISELVQKETPLGLGGEANPRSAGLRPVPRHLRENEAAAHS